MQPNLTAGQSQWLLAGIIGTDGVKLQLLQCVAYT